MRFSIKSLKIFTLAAIVTSTLVGANVLRAADPTVTITSPVGGSTVSAFPYKVEGSFKSDTDIKSVQTVTCLLNNSNRCTTYIQDVDGTVSTNWRSVQASLTTGDSRSGNYSLEFKNLAKGKYQTAVYAIDQVVAKGPRTTVNFTIGADPVTPGGGTGTPTASTGFVTIMWGRTNWQATMSPNCTAVSNARTLEQNAQDLKDRGLFGVGGVVVNRTLETDRTCFNNYTTQPSWADLNNLRDNYDWKFISQGMNYADMTLMTNDADRYNESGATLPILAAHGHDRAWGAFNYANNKQDAAAQAIVNQYFAFGRKYGPGTNTRTVASQSPYIMSTNSVNGGRCNNKTLPCYNMPIKNDRRSTSPVVLSKVMSPKDNEWGVVQFYRLVEGKYGKMGDNFAWDCSSANWQDRWTSQPEVYCRESFLFALDSRTTKATVTDPATVAEAWNILPSATR